MRGFDAPSRCSMRFTPTGKAPYGWVRYVAGGFLVWVTLFFAGVQEVRGLEWRDSPEAAVVFAREGASGTFALYDASIGVFSGFNRERAEQRFIPASTFKIPNSLIGLSLGVVRDTEEVLPYGGGPQQLESWERDMGLRDAIAASSVPIYQELARRTGLERMRAAVAELGYGNGDIGDTVDVFWLRGPLAISAVEQCLFLARLARSELPLPEAAQREVRTITELEWGDGWILHGKTGTASVYSPYVGWWVGWVEKDGKTFSFAINLDKPANDPDFSSRVRVGKACLGAMGIL